MAFHMCLSKESAEVILGSCGQLTKEKTRIVRILNAVQGYSVE